MAEDNRHHIVAEALHPVLEDGEAFQVFCQDGEVVVTDLDTSALSVSQPALYGRLLSLNTQIEEAGAGLSRLPLLLVFAFCVGLHLRLLDNFLGPDLSEKLASVWFYLLAVFATFQLLEWVRKPLQRSAYREGRDELMNMVLRADLDRDRLLAAIEHDAALAQVSYFLKLDPVPPRLHE